MTKADPNQTQPASPNDTDGTTEKGRTFHDWEPKFLEDFAVHRDVTRAAKVAGIGRVTAYRRRKASKDFRERWDEILDERIHDVEVSVFDRILHGWDEPVFHEGQVCGYKKRYPGEALTIFMLKAWDPDRYRFSSFGEAMGRTVADQFKAARMATAKAATIAKAGG